ncbi:MAG TPA: SRPBCC family protein [Candidatus Saccharimonadia bacterium]|nr:SRPBCC family protein [Candidatus Saccharimonadia bacterium]
MKSFSSDTKTNASPTQAWKAWTDLPNWKSHDPTIDSITLDRFENGARAKLKNKKGPGATLIIEDVVPGKSFTIRTNLPLCTMLSYHSVLPTEDGGARFVFKTEFHGLLGGLFYAMFGKDIAKDSEPNMKRLSELAQKEY